MLPVAERLTSEHNGSLNVCMYCTPSKAKNANAKRKQTNKICCGAYCAAIQNTRISHSPGRPAFFAFEFALLFMFCGENKLHMITSDSALAMGCIGAALGTAFLHAGGSGASRLVSAKQRAVETQSGTARGLRVLIIAICGGYPPPFRGTKPCR